MARDSFRRWLAGTAFVLAGSGLSSACAQQLSLALRDPLPAAQQRQPTGIFAIFAAPPADGPRDDEAAGAPITITPDPVALAAIKNPPARKLVKVPAPPIPVRPMDVTEEARQVPAVRAAEPAPQATVTPEKADEDAPAAESARRLVNIPAPPIPVRPRQPETLSTARAGAQTESPPPVKVAAVEPVQPQAPATGFFSIFSSFAVPSDETSPQEESGGIVRSRATKVTTLDLTDPYRPKKMAPNDQRDDDLEDDGVRKLVEKQVDHVEIACLKPSLMKLIHAAGDHFGGTPIITSGYRNRGRRGSYHRKCEAADFFITGVSSGALTSYLKSLPGAGGVGTYCHTKSVHIDTGEPRNWHQCGFRRSFALRAPVPDQIGSR